MRILAIETSCDDTSIALVSATGKPTKTTMPEFEVLANIVSSQTAIHRHWGGVVPNLAKREHIRNLPIIFKKIVANFSKSKIKNQKSKKRTTNNSAKIDAIAVTVGPGLEPALWTGIEFAKKLSAELKVPLVGANHLEGHLYSFLLPSSTSGQSLVANFPAVALLVSGGHTMLLLMKDILHWKLLGETRDDAVGEAFDKVARMLGLPYPGGPEIEKLALRQAQGKLQNPKGTIKFPRPMMHKKNYDFSFSGLKTAVLYYVRGSKLDVRDAQNSTSDTEQAKRSNERSDRTSNAADIAASFQSAAVDVLVSKTIRAAREFDAQSVMLCGGVAANTALREALHKTAATAGAAFIAPAMEYNTDNAAMIAAAAYMGMLRQPRRPIRGRGSDRSVGGKQSSLPMEANGNLGL